MKRCLTLIEKLSVEGNKMERIHGWPGYRKVGSSMESGGF